MRHENKGCDSEFIHIDPDEADIRDKYTACNTYHDFKINKLINVWLIWNYLVHEFKVETN